MKFAINVAKQNRCPVCKKPGPGTHLPTTPRPAVASIYFHVMSFVHGRSYPVYLGSQLILGWDSGVSKRPESPVSLGAAFVLARKKGRRPDVGNMGIEFCSTRCMRRFFKQAIDELDRRIKAVKLPSKRS